VYINKADHIFVKEVKEIVKEEYETHEYVQPPTVFVEKQKTNTNKIIPLFGEIVSYKDKVIDMDRVNEYMSEVDIPEYMRNSFVNVIEKVKTGDVVYIGDAAYPSGYSDFDFNCLFEDKNLSLISAYKLFSQNASQFFKKREYDHSLEELAACVMMNNKELESFYKDKHGNVSKSGLKKGISALRKEIRLYQEENEIKEYVEVKPPRKLITTVKTRDVVKKRYVRMKKPLELESEDKMKSYEAHLFKAEKAILARNSKFIYHKMKKKIKDRGQAEHLRALVNGMRKLSRRIRKLLSSGGFLQGEPAVVDRLKKKNILTDEFLKDFGKLKKEMTIERFEDSDDVDFNIYDFEEVNLIKRNILLGQMCWSRKDNKIKATRRLRSLVQCITFQ
jgi:hypothetical protein